MPKDTTRNHIENNSPKELFKKSKEALKLTWPEELWSWVHSIVKWTSNTILNTVAAGTEFVRAWTSKIAQITWSKNPEIRKSREKIVRHHLNQGKNASAEILYWGLEFLSWTIHTTRWAVRTILDGVYDSWKETITWLRSDELYEEPKKTPAKKISKTPKRKSKKTS